MRTGWAIVPGDRRRFLLHWAVYDSQVNLPVIYLMELEDSGQPALPKDQRRWPEVQAHLMAQSPGRAETADHRQGVRSRISTICIPNACAGSIWGRCIPQRLYPAIRAAAARFCWMRRLAAGAGLGAGLDNRRSAKRTGDRRTRRMVFHCRARGVRTGSVCRARRGNRRDIDAAQHHPAAATVSGIGRA